MKLTQNELNIVLNTTLTDIGIPVNTAEALHRSLNVLTVGQLLRVRADVICDQPNVGVAKYAEIMRAISRCGFKVNGVHSTSEEIARTLYRIGVKNTYTQESWMVEYAPKL